ncbi:DinB family protein [Aquisphaera insulae]|uniref:DinB family protein n=1 Tax=Aquisphaera insulae TaxID=2712864 RepID=UPI0013EE2406|nr:DinB family protein [Aquisphaera insulae]
MPGTIIASYCRWLEYEDAVHRTTLASFETVPVDRRDSAEYRRAVTIQAHVVIARGMWLPRLGVIPSPPFSVASFFPEDAELPQVAANWETVYALWSDYLSGLDDPALDRTFEYQSLDGKRFRNSLRDVLDQLYGHSCYHRGQIAMLIRAAGGKPAITDFIYWCREVLPDAEG